MLLRVRLYDLEQLTWGPVTCVVPEGITACSLWDDIMVTMCPHQIGLGSCHLCCAWVQPLLSGGRGGAAV